ncbi:MAG: phenylalanine--tRNA ligase subunit alpha [Thermodesulfobacteriota bacterium]|nr:MAG: phenylalanine--tRNA ligase subunit alpha [Thermodesulfobacteriota bacterium]
MDSDLKSKLQNILNEAIVGLEKASTKEDLLALKTRYLGRKGLISALIKELSSLTPDSRRSVGELINMAKLSIDGEIDTRLRELWEKERDEKLKSERIDVTLPGRYSPPGRLHPVTQVMDEVEDIFSGLGFVVAEGPEVELDYYNFEALNLPKDHPARDMQDTFYVSGDVLLRTHTSPVQIRVMENQCPPLRVIAPGTVYRRDSDVTHTPMFHQVEGFMVDRNVTFANLKGVLTYFLQKLFGPSTALRFRPSFFPFTEPSAEVDIECVICGGASANCRVCKGTGWLEILGAGMIHPEVFRAVKYDPGKFTGFAFGIGIERIAMLKFGIDDIRLFFENDIRFLNQF